jgi:hypothetical protein
MVDDRFERRPHPADNRSASTAKTNVDLDGALALADTLPLPSYARGVYDIS